MERMTECSKDESSISILILLLMRNWVVRSELSLSELNSQITLKDILKNWD